MRFEMTYIQREVASRFFFLIVIPFLSALTLGYIFWKLLLDPMPSIAFSQELWATIRDPGSDQEELQMFAKCEPNKGAKVWIMRGKGGGYRVRVKKEYACK